MPTKVHRSEASVMESVKKLLKARGILAFRRNVGRWRNPSGRWVEFGMKGEADFLAILKIGSTLEPVFIECKSDRGTMSPEQTEFKHMVEDYGCVYLLVRSADELEHWLNTNHANSCLVYSTTGFLTN
jgi:hypothetical protein